MIPHTIRFKTGLPPPIALVLCREDQRYPTVIENFDTASAGGLNNIKNQAKKLFGGLQDRDKPCSQIHLAVVLPFGEAPLDDDESVKALVNHDRIMVVFDV